MDSNHRPAVYETAALPLSYAGTGYDFTPFSTNKSIIANILLTKCFSLHI
jgi:hypothetical protein